MVENTNASSNIAASDITSNNKESQIHISTVDNSIKIEVASDPQSTDNLINKQTTEDSPLKKQRFRVNGTGIGFDENLILSTGKPMVSCLKGSRLSNQETRIDRMGVPIET